MSNRSWLFVAAIGLAASLVEAQEQAGGPEDGTAGQEQSADNLPLGFPVRIIEDDETAEASERRERESEQREKDDLIAQQRMADATEAMNEATQSMKHAAWWSFGAVSLGTLLLIWTLFLTRQANHAAIAAVATNRAWMSFDGVRYGTIQDSIVDGVSVSSGLFFKIDFRNSGSSPALDAKMWMDFEIVEFDASPSRFTAPTDPEEGTSIPRGQSATREIALNDMQSRRFEARKRKIHIFVYVSYRNGVDDKLRTTETCVELVHRGGQVMVNGRDSYPFTVQMVGPQNTMT